MSASFVPAVRSTLVVGAASATYVLLARTSSDKITHADPKITEYARKSCMLTNQPESLHHANWSVYVRKVECPEALTRDVHPGQPEAAQGGEHVNGRRTWGHSMLIDPWGEVKAVLAEGEGVIHGELDLTYLAGVRESLPALKHRTM